jgi:hypothetical protein
MAEIAAQIQTKYGLSLRPDWVQACVNYLQSRSLGAVQESILAQALLSDLNACGAGNLPADLKVCAISLSNSVAWNYTNLCFSTLVACRTFTRASCRGSTSCRLTRL